MSGQDLKEVVRDIAEPEKVGDVYVVMYSAGCEGVVVDMWGFFFLCELTCYLQVGLRDAASPPVNFLIWGPCLTALGLPWSFCWTRAL
jgi:hypothetical protein